MTDTTQLGLPLLQSAQAQKHVTVNEALAMLDALVPGVLASRSLATPPAVVAEGVAYGITYGAAGAWSGREGQIAIGVNGGWVFSMPKAGWRMFIADEGATAIHDGSDWMVGAVTLAPSGAGMGFAVTEVDHVIGAGATSVTAHVIPSNAIVFGVTARVTGEITGSLGTWSLGQAGAPDRFGSGLGLAAGSWARGVLSQPTAYYAPDTLTLTAAGGTFSGGSVRIAVHYAELSLPMG